jgi:PAS domain S-box-containing protein
MDDIYRTYFDSMPCFLTVQDREFRIIDANRRFVKNFGDYEGRHCFQVYKQRPERCDDCPVARTFMDGAMHRSEEMVTTIDGKEIWVVVYSTPIRNENGEITSVMEMSADVTKIKLLQQQLRESQDRYRLLFEEVPCFISMQDRDLNIVEANRLHRDAFGTAYGNKCYEVYKHRTKECEPCIVKQTFEDGEIRTHEEVVTSQNRDRMNVLVCTAPIHDASGRITRVIEMSTDITEIRQLQDKLTSVGLLIGSISHGIKGLLNGLDGGIYLVNSGLKKNDRNRIDQGWEIALRNVDRIRSMVMDILYYAKDREPDWQTVSVEEIARDACSLLADKAVKINVKLECKSEGDVGEFEADRQAVRSMLVNLVDNSLDACRIDTQKTDHQVSMEISGGADEVVFKISDNGIGMDQETREKAFSLFFSSKGAGGTGLGLFVAHKIAKTHGGNIKIESEEGKGSTFIVMLHRKRPEEDVADNSASAYEEGQK